MPESLFIVTGASRGLGAAIAEQLLAPDHTLLCISRGTSDLLHAHAAQCGAHLAQWPRDLADAPQVAGEVDAWLRTFDSQRFGDAALINNAGVIARIGPIDECTTAELSTALRVGLESALLLTAAFLRATRAWQAMRQGRVKVLNISSGLGRRAMAGSTPYCAAKAGMDHFSRAAALDEAHRLATQGAGAKIVSLAPGVIDTDMQAQLRSSDATGFPDQDSFLALQAAGQLATPQAAAAKVLQFLQRSDFGHAPVADVRDPG
ncbi:MAG TPA: SDR family NAD(P)-dependent oxidoreductase [Burkholderiaceae bacterium]|nr:SDR family NAD(P)-dependent oxidoreductase [Burkholderiaceae bacterium]